MSPACNGSTALQRFECSNAIEIRNGIMFDFYPGLPHIYIFFLAFVDDSRKFMLSKISRYTVFLLCLILRHMEGH